MINKKINYFVIVVIALFSAALIAINISWPNQQQKQLNRIIARGELRVSTVTSPLFYFNDNQQPTGFDYELAARFADYLGVKLVIRERKNIDELFADLENNKADMLVASLVYNEARLNEALTGPTYYTVTQQLTYRKGKKRPRNLGEIDGKIVVTAGSAQAYALKQAQANEYPYLKIEETSEFNSSQLLQQLAENKIDYTVADSIGVSLIQRVHPEIAIAFEVSEDLPLTWYVKRGKDNSLFAAVLDFFNQESETDNLARLEEKYFGHVGSFDYFDTMTFLKAIDQVLPTYQPYFEKYAGEMDWRLLAAIAWQESHWDPLATSPTGVRGIMMLTRPTAEFFKIEDRLDAEQSIKGGATYINYLMKKLPDSIAEDEKIWFALAAYNMGYGHMLDVRKLTEQQGGDPDSWLDVKARLPLLSKKPYYQSLTYGYARGYEAYRYVENIRRYQLSLVGYLDMNKAQSVENEKAKESNNEAEKKIVNSATIIKSLEILGEAIIATPSIVTDTSQQTTVTDTTEKNIDNRKL